jgi:hypothetical protein
MQKFNRQLIYPHTNTMKLKAKTTHEMILAQRELLNTGWTFTYNFWSRWTFHAVYHRDGAFTEISITY